MVRILTLHRRGYSHIRHYRHLANQLSILSQKATLHFCSECNNLLYPKADSSRGKIYYACRICAYDELTDDAEQVGVTNNLGTDPTLSHSNISCPNCGHEEYV